MVVRKLAQNVAMTTGYPSLAVVMVLAVVASIALLIPGRLRWRRLVALDAEHPASYWVRVALVVGTWVGYAVNDTGPVLVAAMFGIWLCCCPRCCRRLRTWVRNGTETRTRTLAKGSPRPPRRAPRARCTRRG